MFCSNLNALQIKSDTSISVPMLLMFNDQHETTVNYFDHTNINLSFFFFLHVQMERVEEDLIRSKSLRENQAKEFSQQLDALRQKYEQQVCVCLWLSLSCVYSVFTCLSVCVREASFPSS